MLNQDTVTISDPRTAAAFASPQKLRVILALLHQELSLNQLAQAIDARLSLVHHHVRQLVQLGLVKVAREQARGGRPIKIYRTSAPAFFVPAELSGLRPLVGLPAQLDEALTRHRMRTMKGVLYLDEPNGAQMRLIADEVRRREATDLWLKLRLSPEESAALMGEMHDMVRRYQAKATPAGVPFILRLAAAPAPPARNP